LLIFDVVFERIELSGCQLTWLFTFNPQLVDESGMRVVFFRTVPARSLGLSIASQSELMESARPSICDIGTRRVVSDVTYPTQLQPVVRSRL
jgi:hypothetical protein